MGDLRVPHRARRAEARRRDHQAHRARARPAAPVRPAPRHADPAPRAVAATTRPAASAPSTCRSTVCGARSRPTPPTRSICRPCAARATSSIPIEPPVTRSVDARQRRRAERRSCTHGCAVAGRASSMALAAPLPTATSSSVRSAWQARLRRRRRCASARGSRDAYATCAHRRLARRRAAEGPLCPRPDHHHRADRRARRRHRLRLHGAPLAGGDAAPVGGDRARHRGADRHLRGLPGQGRLQHASSRWRATASTCRCRCCRPAICRRRGPSRSSPCSTARCRDEIRRHVQAAVLDRHGRPVAPRRDPRQARQRHPALRRHAHRRPTPRTRTSSCCGWSARR